MSGLEGNGDAPAAVPELLSSWQRGCLRIAADQGCLVTTLVLVAVVKLKTRQRGSHVEASQQNDSTRVSTCLAVLV